MSSPQPTMSWTRGFPNPQVEEPLDSPESSCRAGFGAKRKRKRQRRRVAHNELTYGTQCVMRDVSLHAQEACVSCLQRATHSLTPMLWLQPTLHNTLEQGLPKAGSSDGCTPLSLTSIEECGCRLSMVPYEDFHIAGTPVLCPATR